MYDRMMSRLNEGGGDSSGSNIVTNGNSNHNSGGGGSGGGGRANSVESVHSALLVASEMIRSTDTFMLPRFKEVSRPLNARSSLNLLSFSLSVSLSNPPITPFTLGPTQVCRAIMALTVHESPVIRAAIVQLLPELATFCPDIFGRYHLQVCTYTTIHVLVC